MLFVACQLRDRSKYAGYIPDGCIFCVSSVDSIGFRVHAGAENTNAMDSFNCATFCSAAQQGEFRAQRKPVLRSFVEISATRDIPGLAENFEQFIFTIVNLSFGARFAIYPTHMFSSKHSVAEFELSGISRFQDAQFHFIFWPIPIVIRTSRFGVFQFTATQRAVKEFSCFSGGVSRTILLGGNCFWTVAVYFVLCRQGHGSTSHVVIRIHFFAMPPRTWI